ncbi:MAG TPA: hypothetical protein RMH99_18625, partial [Sandaracinaceae bacterium LLY-WYZ-13_1]|nr:hypothetical protein [Sandaracinaceae bacterium LLY-WYZ-13_1]
PSAAAGADVTRRLLPSGLLLVALALAGCADAPATEAALELGTGSWRFEPLEDGQEVALVRGAQGGWHVWVSLRVRGVEGEPPPVRLALQPADESRPTDETTVALPFDPPRDDGWRQLVGYTGIVYEPACTVDELLRITVSMTMADGRVLTAERDVRVRGGAYPPPPCDAPSER